MAPVGKGGGVFPFMKEVEPGDGSLHLAVEENFTELSDLKLQFTQVAMQVRLGHMIHEQGARLQETRYSWNGRGCCRPPSLPRHLAPTFCQVFGSGYTWLVLETSLPACRPKLKIVPTSNQDIPPANQVPLLLLDVVRVCVSGDVTRPP
jgi:hypothetical protein